MKHNIFNFVGMAFILAALNTPGQSHGAGMSYIQGKHYTHIAFIAKENNEIIEQIGDCDDRHAPFSTFKVPLALMGFDAGILETTDLPKLSYKKDYFEGEYVAKLGPWYTTTLGAKYNWLQDHTPATYMKNSVVWFSHQITQQLGTEKFQQYVTKLNYGNKDVSGTPGKDDGLLNSWLGNSLQVSPREQVEFLEKLLADELDVSKDAQKKTREIMDRDEAWDGWKLYGKTGGGDGGNRWFVGWIEKDGRRIVFALYVDLIDRRLKQVDIAKENILKILRNR